VTLTLVAGTDGRTHRNMTCNECNKKGHHHSSCPDNRNNNNNNNDNIQLLMNAELLDFNFLNATMFLLPNEVIPSTCILLDNQSTINCFKDSFHLRNTRKTNELVTVHCNAGKVSTNLISHLPGYPKPVWCLKNGIANILSLEQVEKHFNVTCADRVFTIHKANSSKRDFARGPNGLQHWDANASCGQLEANHGTVPSQLPQLTKSPNAPMPSTSMLNWLEEHMKGSTHHPWLISHTQSTTTCFSTTRSLKRMWQTRKTSLVQACCVCKGRQLGSQGRSGHNWQQSSHQRSSNGTTT